MGWECRGWSCSESPPKSMSWGGGQAAHPPQCPCLRARWALPYPCSKCGTLPPESCFFSLICSLGSFMGKCPLMGELTPCWEAGVGGEGLQVAGCDGAVSPSCSHPGGAAALRPPPGAPRAIPPQHPGAGHWLGLCCWPHHGRQLPSKSSPWGGVSGDRGGTRELWLEQGSGSTQQCEIWGSCSSPAHSIHAFLQLCQVLCHPSHWDSSLLVHS